MQTKKEEALKATIKSIFANTCLAIIKAITGILGNSFALIADAIESTTDIISSTLVLFGLKYSTKPADKNHPYGHGRAEPLITFLVVVFLLVSATIIAYESIHKIRTPHEAPKSFTLIVLGFIILVKEIFYRFISKKSSEIKSTALKAEAWHHRSDAITSIMVFIGISIAITMGKGYENADDWAALVASVIIVFNAYLIFRPALGEIMDENVYEALIAKIRDIAVNIEGVKETEKCFVRKTGMLFYVDLHVVVDGTISVKEGHDISHLVKNRLINEIPEITNVLIHIEPDKN